MVKKILNVIQKNFIIIICIVIFILFCIFIKDNHMDVVNKIDSKVFEFFNSQMITANNTEFMKNVTHLGGYVFIGLAFIFSIILFKNKIIFSVLSIDLLFVGGLSLGLKAFFSRARPVSSLINLPLTYSFPSGHTMIATGFYGLIIYFIWRSNISKLLKYILTFIISMIIIFIGISRIYLGVHYFSDVIGGFIFGILSLILLINIYLNYEWRWKK